jgi:DNA-binding XRE family transcriptional regulator
MRRRTTLDELEARALKNPAVKAEYDALAAAYAVKRGLIAMRKAKGMTQEDVASLLGTRKSNISRLESVNSDVSPRLKTVESYARALGYRMTIKFERERAKR